MATNVFISYRRDDTRDFAGRIADRLRATPEIDDVFIDVDGIEPGADFPIKIESALKQCAICLLTIGPNWLGLSERGTARIMDERDWVRMEARQALASVGVVVPVLASGAAMPTEKDLPEDLCRLARLNAIEVRHEAFDRDTDYLIGIILKRKRPSTIQSYLDRHQLQSAILLGGGGLVVALITLVLGAALHQIATGGMALNQTLGGTGPVILLVAAVLGAGTAAPFLIRRRWRRRSG